MTEKNPARDNKPLMSSLDIQSLFARGNELKVQAVTLATTLQQRAAEARLPDPPAVFQRELSRLQNDEYRVVVVGEIKKGKSCLLNALIGQKVLPEDVPVATCQAFRIAHAATEGYRLRFEDGSTKPIGKEELLIYGSQVVVDSGATPTLDKMIRWIEIDIPFRWMPQNVVLFDTPGLGGLQTEHRDVTYNILERELPDAVLFVLDSMAPINNIELKAVDRIATQYFMPHIFFVQTKVDLRESKWEMIRDKSILNLRSTLGDKLGPISITPIASKRLQDANDLLRTGSDQMVAANRAIEDSRFPEFLPSMMTFLYRIIGWSRAFNVTQLSNGYLTFGERAFASRLSAIDDQSGKIRKECLQAEWAKHQLFTDAGSEWQQLAARVRRDFKWHAKEAGFRFPQLLRQDEYEMHDVIDSAETVVDLQSLAESFDQQVLRVASDRWVDMKDRLTTFVGSCFLEMSSIAEPELAEFDRVDVNVALPPLMFGADVRRRIVSSGGHATTGGFFFGYAPLTILTALGMMTPGLNVALIATGLAGTIWGLKSGWDAGAKSDAEVGKSKLLNRLKRINETIRPHYLHMMTKMLIAFEQALESAIKETTARKVREAEAEIKRLQDESKLSESELLKERARTDDQSQQWRMLRSEVDALASSLDTLYHSFQPDAPQKKAV